MPQIKSPSLKAYRENVARTAEALRQEALRLTDQNLLTAKMALMDAVRLIELERRAGERQAGANDAPRGGNGTPQKGAS